MLLEHLGEIIYDVSECADEIGIIKGQLQMIAVVGHVLFNFQQFLMEESRPEILD